MTTPKIVIVTGANRGIGLAICRLILSRHSLIPLTLFAASRQGEDLGLTGLDSGREVLYPKLDISSTDSIGAFAADVRKHGRVDALINNAGVNLDGQYGLENARWTLNVNYRGTLEMCKTFIPLMAHDGRIVNLSSVASSLNIYSEAIKARFKDPNLTLEDLEQIAQDYEHSVQSSTETTSGFSGPGRSYNVSKACMNALTLILARENPGLSINACCPGWIATEMGRLVGSARSQPPKTPEEGAKIPVRLALDDLAGVSGKFWANASVRSRGEGEVREW